ncbi:MAG: trypsin-like peptidase domain-containing protein [Candidatus Pacearchaeota archaeon]
MERHHKIIIGSFSSMVFIFMIVSGVLIYALFVRQDIQYNSLNSDLKDTQGKINEITNNLMQTKEAITSLDESLKLQMEELKAQTSEDFSAVVEDSIKSVVTIRTDTSQGTGFIVNNEGYLVTNAHVLVGGKNVNAITYNQEIINAELIGYDGELDIALLKISGEYSALTLANSDNVQIGEKVIAIGNPLGLQFSVSEGIVSAVKRPGLTDMKVYIQTDAALNPGNSGGPLINKQGEVIGINNFKVGGGESLGFALESNKIKEAINKISQTALQRDLV